MAGKYLGFHKSGLLKSNKGIDCIFFSMGIGFSEADTQNHCIIPLFQPRHHAHPAHGVLSVALTPFRLSPAWDWAAVAA